MSWIHKVKIWWNSLLNKPNKSSDFSEKEKTPTVEIAKTPGIKCPECSNRIVVSIQNLVNLEPVNCPGCGLELTIDIEESQPALESLRKLQSGLDQAAKVKHESLL
jgi:transcription elongation factor Elf1